MTAGTQTRELAGQTALVVGGGRNIGRAIGIELGARGANVAIAVRQNEAEARHVADEVEALGVRSLALLTDVADSGQVTAMVAEVRRQLGPVTILVYSAVQRMRGRINEITVEDWDHCMGVNLSGAFFCIRAVVDDMKEQGFGRVVAITGLLAGAAMPGPRARHSHLAAAKAGLDGLIRELAVELGPFGITCNSIAPGPIETRRPLPATSWSTHVGRRGLPEDIAYVCATLCSPRGSFVNGQIIPVDGGGLDLRDLQPVDQQA